MTIAERLQEVWRRKGKREGQHAEALRIAQRMLADGIARETVVKITGLTADEIAAEGTPADVVPHKVMPGNRPTTSILATKLTPSVVGQLIALYEHQVFTEGVIWGIDSFDQWGVELGKELGKGVYHRLVGREESQAEDLSTQGLISYFRSRHRG